MDGMNLSKGFSTSQAGIGNQAIQSVYGKEIVLSQQNTILDLKPGDVFRGEIVAVGGEEVQLKLANEQLLTARMEGRVQLAIGQILGFQVQSNENAKVILKPVFTNQMQMQVGEAALKTAGLPLNDKNMQLISDMIENGLPIDKKGLSDVYRQVLQHPDTNMHTIVQLNKLHFPVNDTNIQQLENYQNMSYRIQDSVADVIDDIWEPFISPMHKEIMQDECVQRDTVSNTDTDVMNSSSVYDKKTLNAPFISDTLNKQGNIEEQEGNSFSSNSDITSKVQYMEKIMRVFVQDLSRSEQVNNKEVSPKDGQQDVLKQENEQLQQESQLRFKANSNSLLENETIITSQKVIDYLETGNTSLKQLAELLENSSLSDFPLEERYKLFQSKAFHKLLENTVRDEWSISTDEIAKEDRVQNLYKRLQKQVVELEQIIDQETHISNTGSKALQNLRQNLEFMHEMNQVFQYVQLPIKFTQNRANGELYVYTNKKKFTGNEGTLTAFLHLDMEHMGPVNVHVSLETMRNRVNTRFEVTSDMIPFLSSYLKELDKRIENLGYIVKSTISPIAEGKNMIQQLEEQTGASNVTLSYQTFDMRA